MATFKPSPAGMKKLEDSLTKKFAEAQRKGEAKTPAGENPAAYVATELEAIGVKVNREELQRRYAGASE